MIKFDIRPLVAILFLFLMVQSKGMCYPPAHPKEPVPDAHPARPRSARALTLLSMNIPIAGGR